MTDQRIDPRIREMMAAVEAEREKQRQRIGPALYDAMAERYRNVILYGTADPDEVAAIKAWIAAGRPDDPLAATVLRLDELYVERKGRA